MTRKRKIAVTKYNIKPETKKVIKMFKKGDEVNIEFCGTVQHDSTNILFVNQEGEINTVEINKNNAKIEKVGDEEVKDGANFKEN